MAKRLPNAKPILRRRHNWPELMDGVVRVFVRGVDFDNLRSIQISAYRAAAKLGTKARTEKQKNGNVYVQFVPLKSRKNAGSCANNRRGKNRNG